MTRGRPARRATGEALPVARLRGGVLEIPEASGLPFEFEIFCPSTIVYVKVKRVRTMIREIPELEHEHGPVIRQLRAVPESLARTLEIWILSSHKKFQFFRVLPDRVTEVRSDGSIISGSGPGSGASPGTTDRPGGAPPADPIAPSRVTESVITGLSEVDK